MAESEYKPFKSESFRKFVLELKEHGATVSCAVVYANGRMTTDSGDWIPHKDSFVRLKTPLSTFYKKQATVVSETAAMVKQFIGKDTPYGEGECLLWDHAVSAKSLKYSSKVLAKYKWKNNFIRLSDVVEWKDFKIKSFGMKPSANLFKVKL